MQNPSQWANFPPAGATPANYTMGWWLCVTLVALTLLLASLTYKYIEVPSRNYLNNRFTSKKLEPVKVVN